MAPGVGKNGGEKEQNNESDFGTNSTSVSTTIFNSASLGSNDSGSTEGGDEGFVSAHSAYRAPNRRHRGMIPEESFAKNFDAFDTHSETGSMVDEQLPTHLPRTQPPPIIGGARTAQHKTKQRTNRHASFEVPEGPTRAGRSREPSMREQGLYSTRSRASRAPSMRSSRAPSFLYNSPGRGRSLSVNVALDLNAPLPSSRSSRPLPARGSTTPYPARKFSGGDASQVGVADGGKDGLDGGGGGKELEDAYDDFDHMAGVEKEEGPIGEIKSRRHWVFGLGATLPICLQLAILYVAWWRFEYSYEGGEEEDGFSSGPVSFTWDLHLQQDCRASSSFCKEFRMLRGFAILGLLSTIIAGLSGIVSAYRHVKLFGYGCAGMLLLASISSLINVPLCVSLVKTQDQFWMSNEMASAFVLNILNMVVCFCMAAPVALLTRVTPIYFVKEEDVSFIVQGGRVLRALKNGLNPFSVQKNWIGDGEGDEEEEAFLYGDDGEVCVDEEGGITHPHRATHGGMHENGMLREEDDEEEEDSDCFVDMDKCSDAGHDAGSRFHFHPDDVAQVSFSPVANGGSSTAPRPSAPGAVTGLARAYLSRGGGREDLRGAEGGTDMAPFV